jgi:hypothetical protein
MGSGICPTTDLMGGKGFLTLSVLVITVLVKKAYDLHFLLNFFKICIKPTIIKVSNLSSTLTTLHHHSSANKELI